MGSEMAHTQRIVGTTTAGTSRRRAGPPSGPCRTQQPSLSPHPAGQRYAGTAVHEGRQVTKKQGVLTAPSSSSSASVLPIVPTLSVTSASASTGLHGGGCAGREAWQGGPDHYRQWQQRAGQMTEGRAVLYCSSQRNRKGPAPPPPTPHPPTAPHHHHHPPPATPFPIEHPDTPDPVRP